MKKFKVGDKVKIVGDNFDVGGHKDGTTGTITGEYTYKENCWWVKNEIGDIYYNHEDNIQLLKKSWDTLSVGDILVNKDDDEAKVLAVLGDVLLRSVLNDFDIAVSWYTKKEIQNNGWKIKDTEEVEEMTQEEIEKKLGKKIRITAK